MDRDAPPAPTSGEAMETAALAFGSVLAISAASLIGLAALAWSEQRVRRVALAFVSFAVGALLGDVFFHLLPETYGKRGSALSGPLLVLGGLLGFFVIEKAMRWRRFPLHTHALPDGEPRSLSPVVFANLIGDGLHNLVDGMLVAASFMVSMPLGVSTALAVLLHEIPQEIGDFGILVHGGLPVRRALRFNLLSAAAAFVGAGAALALGSAVHGFASALVPVTAGGFIYIAAADLIPELQQQIQTPRSALAQLALIGAGIGVMAWLARFD